MSQSERIEDCDSVTMPTSESFNWSRITPNTAGLAQLFQDVMAEMDSHYAEGDHAAWGEMMVRDGCAYFVGQGSGFDVVIGYQWDSIRARYRVLSIGFRGSIEPHQALALMGEQALSFLQEHQQSSLYAIIPTKMDNPRIGQLHGLIPWFPGWTVTGGHHVEGGTFWRIEPITS